MNFKCEKCGEILSVTSIVTKFTDKKITLNGDGTPLICLNCGSDDMKYIEENKGFCTNVNLFNIKSPEQKKEILKKRALEHSKKPAQIEQRKNFDKNFGGKIDSTYY